jgi:hypothetical protein
MGRMPNPSLRSLFAAVLVVASACAEAPSPSTAAAGFELDDDPPIATEIAVAIADKIELDPTGKTKCDGNNSACFAADKEHCKEGDYTGACWCTHCEGGNICETQTDHQAHDDKCKLKATTTDEVAAPDELPGELP